MTDQDLTEAITKVIEQVAVQEIMVEAAMVVVVVEAEEEEKVWAQVLFLKSQCHQLQCQGSQFRWLSIISV